MRLLALLGALVVTAFCAVVLLTNVVRPAAAADRLHGVSVVVTGQTTEDLGGGRHRLRLTADVSSSSAVGECLGFALDEPFRSRRMEAEGGCVRPMAGLETIHLTYDALTDDDLAFPSHTLVWGIPGGRCGPILEAFGVCVVEQAGTADVQLPTKNPLPSWGPLGSFTPLFSFGPFYSIEP